ncbi:TspO/MBR family protein [uncultured Anaeromusa sp.]|uniref:TspO/MBR family protein n=1 Tax=uncultured Anaeromusa sp. TaxID=673273 RepID=UPI0029C9A40A|nr:TspO/MBR family protein [uncultured Anaeromusa sp.]
MKSISKFILSLLSCFGAGAIGGVLTQSSLSTWYAQLVKPELSPPNWVFAPVWNVLYFLMAIALYRLLISERRQGRRLALAMFVVQLLLNIAWSAVFFGLHSPGGGLVVIAFLVLAIGATMLWGRRVSKVAAVLLAPYLGWVCFAAYLNYQFWRLN